MKFTHQIYWTEAPRRSLKHNFSQKSLYIQKRPASIIRKQRKEAAHEHRRSAQMKKNLFYINGIIAQGDEECRHTQFEF